MDNNDFVRNAVELYTKAGFSMLLEIAVRTHNPIYIIGILGADMVSQVNKNIKWIQTPDGKIMSMRAFDEQEKLKRVLKDQLGYQEEQDRKE